MGLVESPIKWHLFSFPTGKDSLDEGDTCTYSKSSTYLSFRNTKFFTLNFYYEASTEISRLFYIGSEIRELSVQSNQGAILYPFYTQNKQKDNLLQFNIGIYRDFFIEDTYIYDVKISEVELTTLYNYCYKTSSPITCDTLSREEHNNYGDTIKNIFLKSLPCRSTFNNHEGVP